MRQCTDAFESFRSLLSLCRLNVSPNCKTLSRQFTLRSTYLYVYWLKLNSNACAYLVLTYITTHYCVKDYNVYCPFESSL